MPTIHQIRYPKRPRLPWPSSRLERDVLQSLMTRARLTGRPVTEVVAVAIASYLDQLDAEPQTR